MNAELLLKFKDICLGRSAGFLERNPGFYCKNGAAVYRFIMNGRYAVLYIILINQ